MDRPSRVEQPATFPPEEGANERYPRHCGRARDARRRGRLHARRRDHRARRQADPVRAQADARPVPHRRPPGRHGRAWRQECAPDDGAEAAASRERFTDVSKGRPRRQTPAALRVAERSPVARPKGQSRTAIRALRKSSCSPGLLRSWKPMWPRSGRLADVDTESRREPGREEPDRRLVRVAPTSDAAGLHRALGLVILHELSHALAGATHRPSGLMSPGLSRRQLIDPRQALDRDLQAALREGAVRVAARR